MFPRKVFKRDSMLFVIGVSVLLLIGAMVFPMQTSLGQGMDEYVLNGWVGVYDPVTQAYHFRAEYADGTFQDIPMNALPQTLFEHKLDSETFITSEDLSVVLQSAYQHNASKLDRLLGTYHNVPGFATPFAQAPVAYSVPLLHHLFTSHIRMETYGGPVIPTALSTYLSKLPDLRLQIDTKADANSLKQCAPGEVPSEAAKLLA